MNGIETTTTLTAAAAFNDFCRASLRLLTFRTTERSALLVSERAATVMVLWTLALLIGLDRVLVGSGAQFYPDGLLAVAWYVVAGLVIGLIGSRLSEPSAEFRYVVMIAIAIAPVLVLASFASQLWAPPELQGAVSVLLALYVVVVLERALRSITLRRQPRAAAAMMLLACAVAWMTHHYYFTAQFWYPGEESDYTAADQKESEASLEQGRAAESTLFEQADRIRADIAALDRPATLPAAAFFVGFAGTGEQHVFAAEIDLAAQVIGAKFGTASRTLRLVNDQRNLADHPLASPTALRFALKELARKMDTDNDVLFIGLSSHGSEEGSLSVSNADLPMHDLVASDLADALHESGIKWRVVIVSACFAGTFIEPLRNEHTIVITAAAADRSSFGCSDDRDLTYFGEAFYRDALPHAPDLRTAFERAKAVIAEREKIEDKEASNPQAHFGATIERHLTKLNARSGS